MVERVFLWIFIPIKFKWLFFFVQSFTEQIWVNKLNRIYIFITDDTKKIWLMIRMVYFKQLFIHQATFYFPIDCLLVIALFMTLYLRDRFGDQTPTP